MPSLKGKTILLIDDGVATGLTIRAAIAELRMKYPKQIVVGVPVIAPSVKKVLEKENVIVQSLITDPYFSGVGSYYLRFPQITDEEVIELLKKSKKCEQYHRKMVTYCL